MPAKPSESTNLEFSLPEDICSIVDVAMFMDLESSELVVNCRSGLVIRAKIPEQFRAIPCIPSAKFSKKRHRLIVKFDSNFHQKPNLMERHSESDERELSSISEPEIVAGLSGESASGLAPCKSHQS